MKLVLLDVKHCAWRKPEASEDKQHQDDSGGAVRSIIQLEGFLWPNRHFHETTHGSGAKDENANAGNALFFGGKSQRAIENSEGFRPIMPLVTQPLDEQIQYYPEVGKVARQAEGDCEASIQNGKRRSPVSRLLLLPQWPITGLP